MKLHRLLALLALSLAACATERNEQFLAADGPSDGTELATFGAGCFWCAEAAFEQIEGVLDVRSGFMGGSELEEPTGDALVAAGHAEVVQLRYDPARVSYDELLDWFWLLHDPTQIGGQGADEGPEYRSVIFVRGAGQRRAADFSREERQRHHWHRIKTEVQEAGRFYPAGEDHQDYYAKNRESEYCQTVIAPHLERAGLQR